MQQIIDFIEDLALEKLAPNQPDKFLHKGNNFWTSYNNTNTLADLFALAMLAVVVKLLIALVTELALAQFAVQALAEYRFENKKVQP